jgi:hypothetical protein
MMGEGAMIVLLYTSQWEESAERLQRLIQSSFPIEGIEIYRTLSSLLHRLQNPPDLPFITILMAGERNELFDFRSIDHLLGGARLILVVPDQAEETLRTAHRLRPRYLTYADSDFSGLAQVIRKMAEA